MTNGHPDGNGHIRISRTLLAFIALVVGAFAWAFERYDARIERFQDATTARIDSLAEASRRFQIATDRFARDHERRIDTLEAIEARRRR